jgi:signal transduction histidine kinase
VAYRAQVTTIERDPPAGKRRSWWSGWFTPDAGPWHRLGDVLLAAFACFVQTFGTFVYSQDEPSPWQLDAYAYLLLGVGPAALLFRRRWPEATLVVAFVAAAGYAASGYPRGPAGMPALGFAVVSALMMGRRRAFTWVAVGVAVVAFSLLPRVILDQHERQSDIATNVELITWLPLAAAATEIVRIRLERRAERARVARTEARRRASDERLLIARELHDVLAHNISLINVHSGVALHLLDERPEQARPALEAINEASEEALGELHSVLDVLNRGIGDQGGHGEWAPRTPTAGLRDLDGLVRRTRAAGLDVEVTVEGEARPVPAGVDLAAFRIVQEALTNVVRHAGGEARATVRLAYQATELTVQVDDDGQPAPPPGPGAGRGIAGMRQRVQALDGTFSAGPRPGQGFRVRARLPLHNGTR